jgi:hypothetical protein
LPVLQPVQIYLLAGRDAHELSGHVASRAQPLKINGFEIKEAAMRRLIEINKALPKSPRRQQSAA